MRTTPGNASKIPYNRRAHRISTVNRGALETKSSIKPHIPNGRKKVSRSSRQPSNRGAPIDSPAAAAPRFNRWLGDVRVILGVTSDPYPLDAPGSIKAKCSIMLADTHRPHVLNSLQLKRRVVWVRLEQNVTLVGQFPDLVR
jgi:hypothetical protein